MGRPSEKYKWCRRIFIVAEKWRKNSASHSSLTIKYCIADFFSQIKLEKLIFTEWIWPRRWDPDHVISSFRRSFQNFIISTFISSSSSWTWTACIYEEMLYESGPISPLSEIYPNSYEMQPSNFNKNKKSLNGQIFIFSLKKSKLWQHIFT